MELEEESKDFIGVGEIHAFWLNNELVKYMD